MRTSQKLAFSLLITLILFLGFAFLLYSSFFQILEVNFYRERVLDDLSGSIRDKQEIWQELESDLNGRITQILSDPSFRTILDVSQSAENINRQIGLTSGLLADIRGGPYFRVFDEGQQNLVLSTLDEDYLSIRDFSVIYKRPSNLIPPPVVEDSQLINPIPERQGFILIGSLQLGEQDAVRWEFFLPMEHVGGYFFQRGEIGSPGQLRLISNGALIWDNLTRNERESLTNQADLLQIQDDFVPASVGTFGERKILSLGTEFSLGIPFIYLFPENVLFLGEDLKLLILVALFSVVFLILFLLFNGKVEADQLLRQRLKRFQVHFLMDYFNRLDKNQDPFNSIELKSKQEQLKEEFSKSIGKLSKRKSQLLDELLEKSWQEIIDVISARSTTSQSVNANLDFKKLEQILEKTFSKIKIPVQTVTTVAQGTGQTKASVESKAQLIAKPPSDLEELEELGETNDTSEPGELESLEEVSELESAEEPAELESLEEVSELESAEEPGELESLEEVSELESAEEPGELESLEEVSELESAEEPAELESLEEVSELESAEEPAELESLEEVSELESAEEPGELESLEEVDELESTEEPAELESLEEVDELESAEEPAELESLEEVSEPESAEEPAELESLEEVDELESAEEPAELESLEEVSEPESAEEQAELESLEEVGELESVEETTELEIPEDEVILEPAELEPIDETQELESVEDNEELESLEEIEGPEEELESVAPNKNETEEKEKKSESGFDLKNVEVFPQDYKELETFEESNEDAVPMELLEVDSRENFYKPIDGTQDGTPTGWSKNVSRIEGELIPMDESLNENQNGELEELEDIEELENLGELEIVNEVEGELEDLDSGDEIDELEREPVEGEWVTDSPYDTSASGALMEAETIREITRMDETEEQYEHQIHLFPIHELSAPDSGDIFIEEDGVTLISREVYSEAKDGSEGELGGLIAELNQSSRSTPLPFTLGHMKTTPKMLINWTAKGISYGELFGVWGENNVQLFKGLTEITIRFGAFNGAILEFQDDIYTPIVSIGFSDPGKNRLNVPPNHILFDHMERRENVLMIDGRPGKNHLMYSNFDPRDTKFLRALVFLPLNNPKSNQWLVLGYKTFPLDLKDKLMIKELD